MTDWVSIKNEVEKCDGVLTVTMQVLRDAHGAGRTGPHVLAAISSALAGIGLGHVPVELPSYQYEQVRLYKKGTSVGDLIDTVLAPGEQNDKKLAGQYAGGGVDYAAILQKVRALVAE